ncbi:type II toxin-antitoxin system VapC family toxin [Rhizobium sp. BK602]|uniref:PIN domain-containing protein n=1 Tax=Rhizobium sp. BK602 TaxID=2586986 RepID=UPI00161E7116|nr:putative nucleic acid-binding protein [Rhizobium sp. BK602]
MTETLVVDASIAIKWVIEEDGTPLAVRLRQNHRFAAPDLLTAECANILWKKTQRNELTAAEAAMAARLLERSNIELFGMRSLLTKATEMAISLGHPAYDCLYIGLAASHNWRFVTADQRLLRVVQQKAPAKIANLCITLEQAANAPI